MISLVDFLNQTLFPGILTNAAWDVLKLAWGEISDKTWEEIYIDAFMEAYEVLKDQYKKYSDNEIVKLKREDIKKVITQNLAIDLHGLGLSSLESSDLQNRIASSLADNSTLSIGGNRLSRQDYISLTSQIVFLATEKFKTKIYENERIFREAVIKNTSGNTLLLNELSESLKKSINLLIFKIDEIKLGIERLIEIATQEKYDYTYYFREYLASLQIFIEETPWVNLGNDSDPSVEEIYVYQNLVINNTTPDEVMQLVSISSLLSLIYEGRNVYIQGEAGSGKTLLANRLAKRILEKLAENKEYVLIPVMIRAKGLISGYASFSECIEKQVNLDLNLLLKSPLPSGFFGKLPIENSKFILFIDGIDEVVNLADRKRIIQAINRFTSQEKDYQFILISRPNSEIHALTGSYITLEIPSFNEDKAWNLANKWFKWWGHSEKELSDFVFFLKKSNLEILTNNPLYLTLTLFLYRNLNQKPIPLTKSGLVENFVQMCISDEQLKDTRFFFHNIWTKQYGEEGGKALDRLFNRLQELLGFIAVNQLEEKEDNLSEYLVQRELVPEFIDSNWLEKQIISLLQRISLIHKVGDEWVFIHHIFVEYLASISLFKDHKCDEPHIIDLLLRYKENRWKNVLLFLLLKWKDKKPYIYNLLDSIYKEDLKSVLFLLELNYEGFPVEKDLFHRLEDDYFIQVSSTNPPWPYWYFVDIGKKLENRKKVVQTWLDVISLPEYNLIWSKSNLIEGIIELGASDLLLEKVLNPDFNWIPRTSIAMDLLLRGDIPNLTKFLKATGIDDFSKNIAVLGISFSNSGGPEKLYELSLERDIDESDRFTVLINLIISKRYDLLESLLLNKSLSDSFLFSIVHWTLRTQDARDIDFIKSLSLRLDIDNRLFEFICHNYMRYGLYDLLKEISISYSTRNKDRASHALLLLCFEEQYDIVLKIYYSTRSDEFRIYVLTVLESNHQISSLVSLLVNPSLTFTQKQEVVTILFKENHEDVLEELLSTVELPEKVQLYILVLFSGRKLYSRMTYLLNSHFLTDSAKLMIFYLLLSSGQKARVEQLASNKKFDKKTAKLAENFLSIVDVIGEEIDASHQMLESFNDKSKKRNRHKKKG